MDDLCGKEILLGTYEAFVLGYKLTEDKKGLFTSFADHAHSSSVRCIAAADKFMISSGDDENVKIFNLRRRTEHGSLTHADGTINAMKFYDKRHLFTAAEDGRVSILKTGTWRVEKTLLKHQSGVIDLAIHPSGKLALSIGKDRKLVTWNLIKGRSAYVTNIKDIANFVRWSPTGEHYIVGFYRRIDFYSTSSAAVDFSIPGRSNDVVFIDDVTFAVAGEMPEVEIYSMVTKAKVFAFKAHETRVRCLALVDKTESDDETAADRLMVTASNDGFVKVWSLCNTSGGSFDVAELASVDTKCRITCMELHQVPQIADQKTQIEEANEVGEKVKKKAKKLSAASDSGVKAKKVKVEVDVETSSPVAVEKKPAASSPGGDNGVSKIRKKKKLSKK